MKTNICLISMVLLAVGMQAQDLHNWNASFRVTDETGQPIRGAQVTVFYDRMALPNGAVDPGMITGLTDSNGVFTAAHRDRTYGLRFQVEKDDYYTSDMNEDFHRVFSAAKLNQNLNIVLKKIGKPIGMYAKRVDKGPPVFNEPVGYDLMVGDWVAPYGKGVNKDIIFNGKLDKKARNDFDYKLTVSFPKAGDGIKEFTVPDAEKGSGLRSPHEALADGYQTEVVKTMSHHPGQGAKDDMNDPNRNYFFRVRTVLDENGNVKSAHYGKIYGDFMQFSYYLNPTPNDRNIEFAPKQNLLQGLQSFEQVRQP